VVLVLDEGPAVLAVARRDWEIVVVVVVVVNSSVVCVRVLRAA
jgi:hypothetical protein